MTEKSYGRTASGVQVTNELVGKLAEKAEAGYDSATMLRRRGGRPPIGSGGDVRGHAPRDAGAA